jgi:hypothetical protein
MYKRTAIYPDMARRPSGDMLVLSTHEEWPVRVATAPEPGFPDGVERTS